MHTIKAKSVQTSSQGTATVFVSRIYFKIKKITFDLNQHIFTSFELFRGKFKISQ